MKNRWLLIIIVTALLLVTLVILIVIIIHRYCFTDLHGAAMGSVHL